MIDSTELARYQPVLLADDGDRFLRGTIVVHACITSVWIQYWLAYPADKDHAGTDWEMVMFSIPGPARPPTHAVYARHRGAGWRPWDRVEKREGRPVVYASRDKHASYFRPGWHRHGLHLERCNGRLPLAAPLRIGVPAEVAHRLAHTDPDLWAATKLAW